MAEQKTTTNFLTLLQRLWKGTLYVGIVFAYIAILALFIYFGSWLLGLAAFAIMLLLQFLRFIADGVDRVGWAIRSQSEETSDEKESGKTLSYQKRLIVLMVILIHGCNAGLLVQAWFYLGRNWCVGLAIVIVFIEILFLRIRSINKTIRFQQASYGYRDRGLFDFGPRPSQDAASLRTQKMERKLETLKKMAAEGKISTKAYSRAADKYRVKNVMESTGSDAELWE